MELHHSSDAHLFCGACGAETASEWRFCMQCGHRVGRAVLFRDRRSWTEVGLGLAVAAALFMASHHAGGAVQSASLNWTPTSTVRVTVPADRWVDTGITVPPGATIHIQATGAWNPWQGQTPDTGPDGIDRPESYDRMCPSANWGSLVGQIGSNPYFAVGSQVDFTSQQGGDLRLGMNDDFDSGATGDNTGSLDVTISGPFSQVQDTRAIDFPNGASGSAYTTDPGAPISGYSTLPTHLGPALWAAQDELRALPPLPVRLAPASHALTVQVMTVQPDPAVTYVVTSSSPSP